MYCAIIGDIIDSKNIKNRKEVQEILTSVLTDVNKMYTEDVASHFSIALGDEFQGILNSVDNLAKIVKFIKFRMYPVKLRFGIGIGDIHTQILKDQPTKVDGPAFYAAREMIVSLKEQEKKYETPSQDIMIKIFDVDDASVDLINATFALCNTIENKWTQRQRSIIELYGTNGNSQTLVAKQLNISLASISQSLSAANYANYAYAMNKIDQALKNIWENVNE